MSKHRAHGEGTVYLWEEKNLWVGRLTLPDGKRRTKYGKTQKEVKDWLLETRKQMADGLLLSNEKLTVAQFLDRWFEDVAKPRLRQSTITVHECMIRLHIKPALGNLLLTQVTPVHLQNLYAEKQKSGLSKRSVKYIHTIMHQMLDQALKWNLVPRNVADAVDAPTPDKKNVVPLSGDQIGKFLDILREDRLYSLYVIYLGCGLRRGEALALTWEDVDFERGVIYVRKTLTELKGKGKVLGDPKSDKSRRTVGMPEFAMQTLKDHRDNYPVKSDYVFCTSNGTPFSPRNIVRHFKITLKKAGLPSSIRIHDLRHTFVSFLLSENVPPKDVQVIAGHADFSTTMDIYGHLMPGAQQEAAKKADKLFGNLSRTKK